MVFGVDDGSRSYGESRMMIDMAYRQGVKGIFCTSHSWEQVKYFEKYQNNFEIMEK